MSDVTQILERVEAGDPAAADLLLPLVYEELRRLAATRLAHEKPGQTMEATSLVHEAYLRLVGGEVDQTRHWNSRGHFFGAAAEAMRRILVDNARRKQRLKHGGGARRVPLDALDCVDGHALEEVLLVDEALAKLAAEAPDKAELVKLRYFAGMTIPEAAQAMGISKSTAERYWAYAKAFLYCALEDEAQD